MVLKLESDEPKAKYSKLGHQDFGKIKLSSDYNSSLTEKRKIAHKFGSMQINSGVKKQDEKIECEKNCERLFSGLTFSVEFSYTTRYHEKQSLKNLILSQNGVISYVLSRKCNFHLVENRERAVASSKLGQAKSLGVPVVIAEFLHKCVEEKKLLDFTDFEIGGSRDNFVSGKISVADSTGGGRKKFAGNLKRFQSTSRSKIKLSDFSATNEDLFTEEFQLIKWTAFKDSSQLPNYRYCSTVEDTISIYDQLSSEYLHKLSSHRLTVPPIGVGSKFLAQLILPSEETSLQLDQHVERLIKWLWAEAVGEVEKFLSVPFSSIKIKQLNEAESYVNQIKRLHQHRPTDENGRKEKDASFKDCCSKFANSLPLKDKSVLNELNTLFGVNHLLDMCQVIRDIITVSESSFWQNRSPITSMLRSLKCFIDRVLPSEDAYKDLLTKLTDNKDVKIHNVFRIIRPVEYSQFDSNVGNINTLFHGSKSVNAVGILSRGLLMPNVATDDIGVTRSDVGNLGCGLYFSDSFEKSCQYTDKGSVYGDRVIMICDVALGQSCDVFQPNFGLVNPPVGYSSVHGVKKTGENGSFFQDDEFVIYNLNQQRIRYLVHFTLQSDKNKTNILSPDLPLPWMDNDKYPISTEDSIEEAFIIPNKKIVNPGLVDKSGEKFPLEALHIRGKLVDLAGEVVIFQKFFNPNSQPMEAKYVFPLDDNAAVCGFEGFIGNKHIVGKVEEKQKARKDYTEAVTKGHGAYLMEEEIPNVFTVSIGNLPPACHVLIKITYVCEIELDGDSFCFKLPSSVTPWDQKTALDEIENLQNVTDSAVVDTAAPKDSSLQLSISMPFLINKIECPTHPCKIKKTDTVGVVELCPNVSLNSNFKLLVNVSEIHVPRMWVENQTDSESQACMLVFYPEFDCAMQDEFYSNFQLLLDMSNSMSGQPATFAKQASLMILNEMNDLSNGAVLNVAKFGSAYEELYIEPKELKPKVLEESRQFVTNSQANMGNTDIYQLLQSSIFKPSTLVKNIFIVSDGHINNEKSLINLIQTENFAKNNCRLFTFGCSETSNSHLLKNLARFSGGQFEYLDPSLKSEWLEKIRRQIHRACQACLTDVRVQWKVDDENLVQRQAPMQISSLFSGERQIVYGFVNHCNQAVLTAKINGKDLTTVVSASEVDKTQGDILHRLTTRAIIRDWEYDDYFTDRIESEIAKRDSQAYIIDLSKRYSVVSSSTSFVAIEERRADEEFSTEPDVGELLADSSVDTLTYLDWQIDPTRNKRMDKIEELLKDAELSCHSFPRVAADLLQNAVQLMDELVLPENHKFRERVSALHAAGFDEGRKSSNEYVSNTKLFVQGVMRPKIISDNGSSESEEENKISVSSSSSSESESTDYELQYNSCLNKDKAVRRDDNTISNTQNMANLFEADIFDDAESFEESLSEDEELVPCYGGGRRRIIFSTSESSSPSVGMECYIPESRSPSVERVDIGTPDSEYAGDNRRSREEEEKKRRRGEEERRRGEEEKKRREEEKKSRSRSSSPEWVDHFAEKSKGRIKQSERVAAGGKGVRGIFREKSDAPNDFVVLGEEAIVKKMARKAPHGVISHLIMEDEDEEGTVGFPALCPPEIPLDQEPYAAFEISLMEATEVPLPPDSPPLSPRSQIAHSDAELNTAKGSKYKQSFKSGYFSKGVQFHGAHDDKSSDSIGGRYITVTRDSAQLTPSAGTVQFGFQPSAVPPPPPPPCQRIPPMPMQHFATTSGFGGMYKHRQREQSSLTPLSAVSFDDRAPLAPPPPMAKAFASVGYLSSVPPRASRHRAMLRDTTDVFGVSNSVLSQMGSQPMSDGSRLFGSQQSTATTTEGGMQSSELFGFGSFGGPQQGGGGTSLRAQLKPQEQQPVGSLVPASDASSQLFGSLQSTVNVASGLQSSGLFGFGSFGSPQHGGGGTSLRAQLTTFPCSSTATPVGLFGSAVPQQQQPVGSLFSARDASSQLFQSQQSTVNMASGLQSSGLFGFGSTGSPNAMGHMLLSSQQVAGGASFGVQPQFASMPYNVNSGDFGSNLQHQQQQLHQQKQHIQEDQQMVGEDLRTATDSELCEFEFQQPTLVLPEFQSRGGRTKETARMSTGGRALRVVTEHSSASVSLSESRGAHTNLPRISTGNFSGDTEMLDDDVASRRIKMSADCRDRRTVVPCAAVYEPQMQRNCSATTFRRKSRATRWDVARDLLLLDVAPLSLGVVVAGGRMTFMIKRNTTIPTKTTRTFVTCREFQSTARVQIYEGERTMAKYNRFLGALQLSGLETLRRAVQRINVEFELDANGALTVSASVTDTDISDRLVVTGDENRLDKDTVERMIKEAELDENSVYQDEPVDRYTTDIVLYQPQDFNNNERFSRAFSVSGIVENTKIDMAFFTNDFNRPFPADRLNNVLEMIFERSLSAGCALSLNEFSSYCEFQPDNLMQLLKNSGLMSMGATCYAEVIELLAIVIAVIMYALCNRRTTVSILFDVESTENETSTSAGSDEKCLNAVFHCLLGENFPLSLPDNVRKARSRAHVLARKHAGVFYRMELAKNLSEFLARIFGFAAGNK